MIKLMIIDDESSIGAMLQKAFSRSGDFSTSFYDNPVTAMSRFKKGETDVVLLDIMMPQRDGISVLNEIKSIDPDCMVIMMTA